MYITAKDIKIVFARKFFTAFAFNVILFNMTFASSPPFCSQIVSSFWKIVSFQAKINSSNFHAFIVECEKCLNEISKPESPNFQSKENIIALLENVECVFIITFNLLSSSTQLVLNFMGKYAKTQSFFIQNSFKLRLRFNRERRDAYARPLIQLTFFLKIV